MVSVFVENAHANLRFDARERGVGGWFGGMIVRWIGRLGGLLLGESQGRDA
jgi:hypothetical protein